MELARKVIEDGIESEYAEYAGHLMPDRETIPAEVSKEVHEIFVMYEALQSGYESLEDKNGIDQEDIRFRGFDGNDEQESKYMAFARYAFERHGWRYAGTVLRSDDSGNSHMLMLSHYRSMLVQWERAKDKRRLTKDDLVRITTVTG